MGEDKKEKSENERLQEELFEQKRSAWENYSDTEHVYSFAQQYKDFISCVKTERESVSYIVDRLVQEGFQDISTAEQLTAGDKVYKVVRNRCVMAARVGKDPESLRVIASHIDTPRLDIKPYPLYEDSGLGMMKSHYYGGIKKYQWVNVPLSMRALVHTKDNKVEITYGENEGEGQFIIPDLLPHLAKDQMEKKMKEGVSGEDLQVLVGNIPVNDDAIKEKVKFNLLRLLNERYGIVEEDLVSADISFVPAEDVRDIGFDRSLIAAYGQDDRVCAYTSLRAFLEVTEPTYTSVCLFMDKEEIGSFGGTSASSRVIDNFLQDLVHLGASNKSLHRLLEDSYAISADVTDALNPIFKDVHDPQNASVLGHGVSIEKYGGAGGKYMTHEATSEYMSWLRHLFNENDVRWQTGELGKVDQGGGGTIGMFLAKYGSEVIDIGPATLAMHSTQELLSKVDIYEAYRAYQVFLQN